MLFFQQVGMAAGVPTPVPATSLVKTISKEI